MILSTVLMMFAYWIALGVVISVVMITGLYFARACEYIVDFLFKK